MQVGWYRPRNAATDWYEVGNVNLAQFNFLPFAYALKGPGEPAEVTTGVPQVQGDVIYRPLHPRRRDAVPVLQIVSWAHAHEAIKEIARACGVGYRPHLCDLGSCPVPNSDPSWDNEEWRSKLRPLIPFGFSIDGLTVNGDGTFSCAVEPRGCDWHAWKFDPRGVVGRI